MKLFKLTSQSKAQAQYLVDHFKINDYNCIRLGNAVIVELDDLAQSKEHLDSFCYIGSAFIDYVTEYDYTCFVKKFGE